jgi:tetratricopeptide (TPR) repeat protein
VLLLLDFWPLSRFRPFEKLPLLALSLASSLATVFAQWRGGSVGSLELIPLVLRLENALVSYVVYLSKTLWPAGLACFYPYPAGSLALPAAGAAALLGLITVAVLHARKRFPYLAVGWLWYVVMLLPVSGVIQVGMQAMADRYTYLPAIGLYLALVWGVAELVPRRQWVTTAVVTSVIVLALAVTARFQLHHWRDTRALFEHALAVTRLNDVAHVNLGNDFDRTGELDRARFHYERALAIKPSAQAHVNLANVFARSGEADQARAHYEEALRGDPRYAPAHNNLAALAARQGRFEEALEHCRAAIRIAPGYAEAHENLGVLLGQLGQFAEAERQLEQALAAGKRGPVPLRNLAFVLERQGKLEQAEARYEEALKLDPKHADTHRRLGEVLHARGMLDPALAHLRRALELDPGSLETANRLAWILATSAEPSPSDAAWALRLATRIAETTSYEDPSYLETLAAAHAALGDLDAALRWQTKAVELTPAPRRGRPAARLELYRLRAARNE